MLFFIIFMLKSINVKEQLEVKHKSFIQTFSNVISNVNTQHMKG